VALHEYVLGLNLSHDGSACLLKDGQISVAIEKERLTRIKHDGKNDTAVIRYCLEAEGIRSKDLCLIVQNTWQGMFKAGNQWFYGPRILDEAVPVVTVSHHLAHAYGAYGMSGFREAATLVIDNGGNSVDECVDLAGAHLSNQPPPGLEPLYCEVDSYYAFAPGSLRTIHKTLSPIGQNRKPYPMLPRPMMHSIGGLYMAVSMYVFNGMDDPGKLMGLAPYGRPGVYDFEMFALKEGCVSIRYDWMDRFTRPARSYQEFKQNFQYYADIAHWTQREVERAIMYVVNSRYETWPAENLCYCGGVALNAVANRLVVSQGPFRDVYFQPAAGDNGAAIGCAYYGWIEVLKREHSKRTPSVFLGKQSAADRIEKAIAGASGISVEDRRADRMQRAAELLAAGKIVGWFQGGCEFGPRALGNRSILADPRRREIPAFINRDVKRREEFRPFAPAVLAEDASHFFDCSYLSPYMILVAPVRPEWRDKLCAVVHVDGSARLQTVTEEFNPSFYALLKVFKICTGIGVLLNTSLNRRGQPIVETPEEALELLVNSGLDTLIIENWVVEKVPALQADTARATAPGRETAPLRGLALNEPSLSPRPQRNWNSTGHYVWSRLAAGESCVGNRGAPEHKVQLAAIASRT
jgi:carbamoyltransferase